MKTSRRLTLSLAVSAAAAGLWLVAGQPHSPPSASVVTKPTGSGFSRDTGILPVRGAGFQPLQTGGYQPMSGIHAVPPPNDVYGEPQDPQGGANAIEPAAIAPDATTTHGSPPGPDAFGLRSKREVLAQKLRAAPVPHPPVFPLIFHDIPGADSLPSPAAESVIEQLRNDFADEVESTGAAPHEPEYWKKWQRAQPLSDLQLRAWIGQEAFARWQAEAHLARKK